MQKYKIILLTLSLILLLSGCNNTNKPVEPEQGGVNIRDLEIIKGTKPTEVTTEENSKIDVPNNPTESTTQYVPDRTDTIGNEYKKETFPSFIFEAEIPSDFTLERLNDYFYVLIGDKTRIFITYSGGSYSEPMEVYNLLINRYSTNLEFDLWEERLKNKDKTVYFISPNTYSEMEDAEYTNTKCFYNESDISFKSKTSSSIYRFEKALRSYGYFKDGTGGFSTLAISDKYSNSELLKIQDKFLSTVKKLNTDNIEPEGTVEKYITTDGSNLSFNYPSSFTKVSNINGMETLKAAYNSEYEGISINYFSDPSNKTYTDAGSFTTALGSELFTPFITDSYIKSSHYNVITTVVTSQPKLIAGSQGIMVKTYDTFIPNTLGANKAMPSLGNEYVSYRYVANKGTTPVSLIFTAPKSKESLLDKLVKDYADSFK